MKIMSLARGVLLGSAISLVCGAAAAHAASSTQLLCIKKRGDKKSDQVYVTRSSRCKRGFVAAVVGDARLGAKGVIGAPGVKGPPGAPGPKGDKGDSATAEQILTIVDERLSSSPVYFATYDFPMITQHEVVSSIRNLVSDNMTQLTASARMNAAGKWETRLVVTVDGSSRPKCDTGFVENAFDGDAKTVCQNFSALSSVASSRTQSLAWFVPPFGGSRFPVLRTMIKYNNFQPQCAQLSVERVDGVDFKNFSDFNSMTNNAPSVPCPLKDLGDMSH